MLKRWKMMNGRYISKKIYERITTRKNVLIALFVSMIITASGILYFSPFMHVTDGDIGEKNRWLGPKFEAELFSLSGAEVVYDSNASCKKSVLIDDDDVISRSIYVPYGDYNLIIRAKSKVTVSSIECFIEKGILGKIDIRGEYQYYSFQFSTTDGKKEFVISCDDGKILVDYVSIEKVAKNGLFEPFSIIRSSHDKYVVSNQENAIYETFSFSKPDDYIEFHPIFTSNGIQELSFKAKIENVESAKISFLLNDAKVSDFVLNESEPTLHSCRFFISEGVHNIKLKLTNIQNYTTNASLFISSISIKIRQSYHSYIGDLHAHTSYSDGKGLPFEAYSYAKNVAKLDFFAITDHSSLLTDEEYQKTIKDADFASTSYFTALYGQEYGFYFGIRDYNIIGGEEVCKIPFWEHASFYNWVEEKEALVGLNHPIYGKYGLMLEQKEKVSTLEILNGYYNEPFESAYIDALNLGMKVAPVSGQDNHDRDWGMKKTNGRYYLTGLVAPQLDQQNLIDSINERRTYAFTTTEQKNRTYLFLSANGHALGDSFDVDGKVAISLFLHSNGNDADGFKKISLYRDGKVLQELNHAPQIVHYTFEDTPEPGNHYYFIKAEQYDGDTIWSSCIWVF
ncbi:MAG: CehA/McbA family metallohydrolase [Thermoplasmata archaeon]